MAMKGALNSPKPPHYWDRAIRLFSVISGHSLEGEGSYPSAEVQSVYSTAPANWAVHRVKRQTVLFQIIQFSISTQFRQQKSSILSKSV